MIIRIWQGIVLSSNAANYQALLRETIVPSYQRADGNLGVYLCGEVKDQLVNFLVLSIWSSREALIQVTGPNIDTIVHSNEEKSLLLAFESMGRNYEVFEMGEPQKVKESSERK